MGTKGGDRNRIIWRQRRDAWFAEHSVCERDGCNSTDRCKIVWNGKGPKPFRSMTEVFRAADPRRTDVLADCITLCYTHWLETYPRNVHGGGAVGIHGCKCTPCKERRLEYSRIWGREQTRLWRERRDKIIDKGLPVQKRRISKRNNVWNKSEEGRAHQRDIRRTMRDEWLATQVCALCGATKGLRCTWLERPGPLRSTGMIWAYGKDGRLEYLQKCHTLCVSCLRTTTSRTGEKKKEKGT